MARSKTAGGSWTHLWERRSNGAVRVQNSRPAVVTSRTIDHWTVHYWTRGQFLNERLHRHVRRVGTEGAVGNSIFHFTLQPLYGIYPSQPRPGIPSLPDCSEFSVM